VKALLLVVAIACAALVAATHASARMAACTPGGHGSTRTFCGPANATLKSRGRTYRFNQGGRCSLSGSNWSINIGTITLNGPPRHRYFGITSFGAKPGKRGAAVSWQLPNGTNQSLMLATVTLSRGLKKGTFSGKNQRGGGKSYGSFSCK
jgi:hypothetical protein